MMTNTISPAQVRAARALLGISVDELSAESGVSAFVILQCESQVPGKAVDAAALEALHGALQRLGVTFLADGDCAIGGEGVRLTRREPGDEGMPPEKLNASNDD
ncbi:hypothetical protein DFR48_102237 [Ciceribacter lividus]|uniref:Helix-turn-helix protein n=1 Tax=Ciceribacter lividus TaxID=1197950 RepID=A0A6I7HSM4_9HYPH|nr:hypothetical protein [Ciceribacter lividus]RCW27752.1 hypothetical protein DFR48_102237 [Ciceribacter lividus]